MTDPIEQRLRLFLVRRPEPKNYGSYHGFVAACNDADEARAMHPRNVSVIPVAKWEGAESEDELYWPDDRSGLVVMEIGIAHESIGRGVILVDGTDN
jgi:hypothetical protein